MVMDCRGNCLLFVCVLHLLINVDCSLIPFGNGGMGMVKVMDQRGLLYVPPFKPNGPSNPMGGTSPCLLKCKVKPNPCDGDFNRKGCPPPINIPPLHGFGNQLMFPFSFPTPSPPPTTTTTKSTTTIPEKDVTEEQHNIFTTTTSPSPQSTTTGTGGITVNPIAFWIISKKK